MTSNICPNTINITSQADVDYGTLSSCTNKFNNLEVRNATGILRFRNQTQGVSVNVYDSPRLEALDFPQLTTLSSLHIKQATSLSNVTLPRLSSFPIGVLGDGETSVHILGLNITGAPSLTEFSMKNVTGFHNVVLVDVGEPNNLEVLTLLSTVTDVSALNSNLCLDLSALVTVDFLELTPSDSCCSMKLGMTSVGDFRLLGATDFTLELSGALAVNGSLVVDSFRCPLDAHTIQSLSGGTPGFSGITTAGLDANLTLNENIDLDLGSLRDVGASLSARDNTNCTFNFKRLLEIGSLSLTDNINSTLPLFPRLERADNIHLRGVIDTSAGPNVFPALMSVTDTVRIEAWNDDFNCSKLVSQWRDNIIHKLFCNGTDNATDITVSTPIPTPATDKANVISQGAWAGIGVAVGVVVLGVVLAALWLILHFKHRMRDLAQKANAQQQQQQQQKKQARDTSGDATWQLSLGEGLHEAEGRGIIREKPDDHVREMHVPPMEAPEDHQVHEMDVLPAEAGIGAQETRE